MPEGAPQGWGTPAPSLRGSAPSRRGSRRQRYVYVLFLSDGMLPGANALAVEQEVRDLPINFFLVSSAFGPAGRSLLVVHPILEGALNLLLDEREDEPNLLPFGPMLLGMQFLTSGFLMPYLFARTPERRVSYGKGTGTPAVVQRIYPVSCRARSPSGGRWDRSSGRWERRRYFGSCLLVRGAAMSARGTRALQT